MQAAERFFEGKFDHIKDEDADIEMATHAPVAARPSVRFLTLDASKTDLSPFL